MFDLVVRNAVVLDGTGAPERPANLAVKDGRIVAVGEGAEAETAEASLDAGGLMAAPGFIDLHTHYDAQLAWDASASPSPLHGVTTVFGGNCGFGMAPSGAGHAEFLMRLLARVEGIPLAALEALSWDHREFGDWLDGLEGGIGPNAGFLVGHSAIRRVVLGPGASDPERTVTAAETAAMVGHLHRALEAGAIGFSTSQAPTHHDGDGRPVPSRLAGRAELEALAGALADHEGTTLELILPGCISGFTDDEADLMAVLSRRARRPANWNVLGVSALDPQGWRRQLQASTVASDRGGQVVALTLPHSMTIRLSFLTGTVLDGLPGWSEVLGLPVPERMRALADPEVRRRMAAGAAAPEAGVLGHLAAWHRLRILETFSPLNEGLVGQSVGHVAHARNQDPFDCLLDVVLADELRTGLRPPMPEPTAADWAERAAAWRDPRTVVGGSDAGAHLDMMCGAVYSTALLASVREHATLSWAEAVHQLTQVPARLYGVRDRGVLTPGAAADVVLFDPERVAPQPERTLDDLPAGASRLYAGAEGIPHVLVNGTAVVRDGRLTGATPGTLLRSGRDTYTVEPRRLPADG